MPNCPHCNNVYFGNPDACPECRYNFKLGRVVTEEELRQQREEEQARRAAALKEKQEQMEKEAAAQRELQLKKSLQTQKIQAERNEMLQKNPRYEYCTELVPDDRNGLPSKQALNSILAHYASQGWRLHTAMTNEAGRNSSSTGVGGINTGTNATVDVTVLIFERCIKPAEF